MAEIDTLIKQVWGGSTKRAQEALGVSRQAISKWRAGGIPKLRRFQIDAMRAGSDSTNGTAPNTTA